MKTAEYLALKYRDITDKYPRPKLLGNLGNEKLGPIYQFSGLSIHTCPGKTKECSSVCYDAWSPKTFLGGERLLVKQAWYTKLSEERPDDLFKQLNTEIEIMGTGVVRIHVGGDFFTEDQINVWTKISEAHPNTLFFGYTRSWRVDTLVEALDRLRARPNVKIFASLDSQTGNPSEDWEWAGIESKLDMDKSNAIWCLEQQGKVANCKSCRLCFNPKVNKNILFKLHGTKGVSLRNKLQIQKA